MKSKEFREKFAIVYIVLNFLLTFGALFMKLEGKLEGELPFPFIVFIVGDVLIAMLLFVKATEPDRRERR